MDPLDISGVPRGAQQRIIVRDFAIDASIGVYAQEYERQQTVLVSVDLFLGAEAGPARFLPDTPKVATNPALAQVVCYDALTRAIRALTEAGHVELVETLAQEIVDLCLSDGRVAACRVRVEKPEAIAGARTVGIELSQARSR